MARINIDTEIWNDPRFEALREALGSKYEAIGALVCAWEVGQNYWKRERSLIPKNIFDMFKHAPNLVRCGFASVRENGVYMHGAEAKWEFLMKASEMGKRSAAARKAKYGTAIPINATNYKHQKPNLRSEQVQTETEGSRRYSSSSSSKIQNTYVVTKTNAEAKTDVQAADAAMRIENSPLLTENQQPVVAAQLFPDLAQIWNDNCGTLPRCRKLTAKRTRSWRDRWKQEPSVEYWADVIRRLASDAFSCGANKTSWKATIDYLLQPDTHVKILERTENSWNSVVSSAKVDALFEEN